MMKYLPFLFKNKSNKGLKTKVKLAIHALVIFIFSFIYYDIIINTTVRDESDKGKFFYYVDFTNNERKTRNKAYVYIEALYFSLVVHTTTGFSALIPEYNIKNNIIIMIHLFIAFCLIISL